MVHLVALSLNPSPWHRPRTSITLSYLEGRDEDAFNRHLEELRADRYAAIAGLRNDARAA